MKKVVMGLALVSFLGATAVMANNKGDEKKKKTEKCEKKSCCKKGESKSCCKKGAEKKSEENK